MSDLFLTKLTVNEFRTFSECEISLPDSPGVLLVCGPNGLGKSTLFDALEWCLSGKVDRFEQANKGVTSDRYLRSWHSHADRQTSVLATFSSGTSTTRKIVGTREIQTGEEPSKLLQSSAWRSPIGDLHNYLLLTHFLGQSTLTRMTHRKADQRWEYLKGPARSDWATGIATSLHGHGNSAEARAFAVAANDAETEAKRLDDLLRTEETLFASTQVAGVVTEAEVIAEASRTIDELRKLNLEIVADSAQSLTGQSAIDRLSETISAFQSWASGRAATLPRIASCLSQYNETNARLSELESSLISAAAAVTGVQQRATSTTTELAELASKLHQARATSTAMSTRVSAVEALRNLVDTKKQQDRSRAGLDSDVVSLENDLASEEERVRTSEKRLRISKSIDRDIRSIMQEINTEEERIKLRADISQLDDQIAGLSSQITALEAVTPDLESRLQQSRDRQHGATAKLQAATATLASARLAVDRLSAAVVSVAAHIDDSTCVCPVCATTFDPGELRRRAAAAAEALGPTLTPLEDLVRQVEIEVQQAATATSGLASQDSDLHNYRQDRSSLIEDRSAKVARYNASIGPGTQSDPIPSAERLPGLQQRANRLRYWMRIIGEPAVLQSAWSTNLLARNGVGSRLAETRKARDAEAQILTRTEEDIQFRMQALGIGDFAPLDGDLQSVRGQKALLDQTVANAELAVQNCQAALSGINEELSVVTANHQSLSAAVDTLKVQLAETITTWKRLGMTDELPSADAKSQAEQMVQAASARIAGAEQTLRRLRNGFSIALQQDAHREGLAQVRLAVGAPVSMGRDAIIQLARSSQARAVAKAQDYLRAQRIAHIAYQQINQRVGAFNQRYLKPLNDLMNKINRAILTDPDVGLDLEFARNSVRQKTRRLRNAPSNIESLDPLLVHSEGQMAALAVSILCAASLTFAWSRWRGLVMDDPLQHNDVVHASAFADLMRNLVHDKGYQVFLSTHDMGQADFLRRKFVAGGVACTVVQLVGRSRDGTLIQVDKQYSSAA